MRIDADGEDSGVAPERAAPGARSRKNLPSGRALITIDAEGAASSGRSFRPTQGVIAAAVALVLGGAFMAGAALLGAKTTPSVALAQAAHPVDQTALVLQKVQDEMHTLKVSVDSMRAVSENSRQDEAIRSLKKSVDVLKQDLEVAKASNAGAVAGLGAKLDRLDRDPSPKLAEIAARLDKLDRSADKDSAPRLAEITARLDQIKTESSAGKLSEITARLDRIEKQVSSPITTGSITPPPRPAGLAATTPVSTQPAAEPKPPARPPTIEGWMLRDVSGGVALLEGRAGLREVAPGQFLPGVGEIRSIERRGRSWVVVTSRGIIEADNRW